MLMSYILHGTDGLGNIELRSCCYLIIVEYFLKDENKQSFKHTNKVHTIHFSVNV